MMRRQKSGRVYKLMSKVRKHPEILLNEKYGFQYFEDEDQEVKVFAQPITLKEDSPLFTQCVRYLEKCYEEATTEEREKDFKDFEFKLELQEDQRNAWRLVLTEDLKKEFSTAQLCVCVDKRVEGGTLLFINSPLQDAYYNAQTIRDCAGEIVDKLLQDKLIYEKKQRYN